MTAGSQLQLKLTLVMPPDFEAAEIEEEQAALGQVLAGLEGVVVVAVRSRRPDEDPSGAKGMPEALGILTAMISSSRQMLVAVLDAVRLWVSASTARSVLVEIGGARLEIRGASTQDVERLIDLFIEQHTRGIEG